MRCPFFEHKGKFESTISAAHSVGELFVSTYEQLRTVEEEAFISVIRLAALVHSLVVFV